MKKPVLLSLLLTLCLLAAALNGCSPKPSDPADDPPPAEGPSVPTYTERVENRDIVDPDGSPLVRCTLTYPEFDSDALNGIVSAYVRSFSDAASASAADLDRDAPFAYEFTYTCQVTRCDEKMVSLLITEYAYLGGPHGSTTFYGLVLEPDTGASISPAQLLGMSDAEARDAVRDAYLALIASDTENQIFYPNSNELLEDILAKGIPTYYVENGEVIFTIQTYDIASYASGPQAVSLPLGAAYAGPAEAE